MDRWVSRSSSGRLTSARSRCSWSAISTFARARAVARRPNRIDVDRVERDLVHRRPALLAGTVGTFDDLFRQLAGVDPWGSRVASEVQRTVAARRAIARVDLGELGASASTAGFVDTLLHTIAELESALVDVDSLDRNLFELARGVPQRARHARPAGSRRRAATRRRAPARRPRRVVGRAGLRVRLRGSDRCRVGAARGALGSNRRHGLDPVRARSRRVRGARANRRATSPRSREDGSRSFAALPCAHSLRRSRISSASSSPTSRRPAPPLDGAIRFLEGAGTRGTVELLASEVATLLRGGLAGRARRDRLRRRRSAGARRSAPPSRSCECRSRSSTGTASETRRSGARCSRSCASPGSEVVAATCSCSCARRSPGSSGARSTSSKGACEDVRSRSRSASTRRASACGEPQVPALSALRAVDDPIDGVRELLATMMRNAWGLDAPPVTEEARGDARAYRVAVRTLDELKSLAAHGVSLEREDVRGGSRADTWVVPEQPSAGRVAILDHEHARTRAFDVVFVLGLEEGAFPRRARPSPLLERRHPSRARGPAGADRTPSRATATSSTRRARARRSGSCSCARPPATRARRARRARSGTTCARCSTTPRWSAPRVGARSRR